ncbi:MAG: hypothetical protein HY057_06615, partial [Rhodospirillales bacterium]|nr:hypothetical protein [Rhodospirillales bacterium]
MSPKAAAKTKKKPAATKPAPAKASPAKPGASNPRHVYLIDGSVVIFRAFYAIKPGRDGAVM